MFRHRALESEAIGERHALVLDRLRAMPWLWKKDPLGVKLDTNGESAGCDLTPFLREGVAGALSYSARYPGRMEDMAMFDDFLLFEIEETAICYEELCLEVFPPLAIRFGSYRASIVNDIDLALDDFEQVCELTQRQGIDIDGRDTVFRFDPVSYFDQELCRRAFQLEVDQVVARLQGNVQHVARLDDGVFIVATSAVVDRPEIEAIHHTISGLLMTQ
ncbi:hypothetical protein C5Y93_16270 [Blastopirellula marina]|uniref:Uncharacterized protein n=1 Tax=Blastopirellula marina TaxID=124 RepID=A0A2S8GKX0_9BACT|nr:hypothetical protein C5Y93_16270 [Blastopirellula marina]